MPLLHQQAVKHRYRYIKISAGLTQDQNTAKNHQINRDFMALQKSLYMAAGSSWCCADWLLVYIGNKLDMTIHLPILIALLVAARLICDELISTLENTRDTEVPLPGFLGRLVPMLKSEVDAQVPEEDKKQSNTAEKS